MMTLLGQSRELGIRNAVGVTYQVSDVLGAT